VLASAEGQRSSGYTIHEIPARRRDAVCQPTRRDAVEE
jgi:hypothetical protein